MVQPIVSIIIPVYNREEFVLKTLMNVLQNKYRPIELVLVDDGSVDNTLNALEQFKAQYENPEFKILVLTQPNKGAPAARNLGFENAQGQYIQFLDSDDLIDPDKFILQIREMTEVDADFGLCDFELVYSAEGRRVYHSNAQQLNKVINMGSFGSGAPLLTKKLANMIVWNEKLKRQQDVDYFLKSALLASKIAYVDKPLYTYVRHDSERISMSYSMTSPVYGIRISSLKEILKYNLNRTNIIRALAQLYLTLFKFKIKKLFNY